MQLVQVGNDVTGTGRLTRQDESSNLIVEGFAQEDRLNLRTVNEDKNGATRTLRLDGRVGGAGTVLDEARGVSGALTLQEASETKGNYFKEIRYLQGTLEFPELGQTVTIEVIPAETIHGLDGGWLFTQNGQVMKPSGPIYGVFDFTSAGYRVKLVSEDGPYNIRFVTEVYLTLKPEARRVNQTLQVPKPDLFGNHPDYPSQTTACNVKVVAFF